MDEYLSAVPLGRSIESVPAEHVLDSADRDMGRKGALVFQWLDFRVKSLNDMRAVSKHLINGDVPKLEKRENATDIKHCYDAGGVSAGKSAVRCDVGHGFTVHHPVTEKVGFRMKFTRAITNHSDCALGIHNWLLWAATVTTSQNSDVSGSVRRNWL